MISTLAIAIHVSAEDPTTVISSTMHFASISGFTLTPDSMGGYSGVIPMIVGGGYDIYAKEDASAWFGDLADDPVWSEVTISNHDAWPTWLTDTPDWYQYSLHLYYDEESGEYRWAIRNHSGTTVTYPWYDETQYGTGGSAAHGVPMSGVIVWRGDGKGYAYETDVGAYLTGTGTPDIPGGAATKGGGSACWDMDWSWGSEAVPLEYPGFEVEVTGTGGYQVTMTPARARGPIPLTVPMKQTQFQWRCNKGPIGDWSVTYWDDNFGPSEYTRSGKVLHTEISYMPYVTEEEGTSMVYVYDKKSELWIMHEGTIGYVSPYGEHIWITEYWKGYLDFGGEEPGPGNFVHGVQYQWGYSFGYDEETMPPFYTNAVWDDTMGAWLLGFSIYIQDPTDFDQETAYTGEVPFPDPFLEPVPKSDYNPYPEGL